LGNVEETRRLGTEGAGGSSASLLGALGSVGDEQAESMASSMIAVKRQGAKSDS
jgi:hypothetical protein